MKAILLRILTLFAAAIVPPAMLVSCLPDLQPGVPAISAIYTEIIARSPIPTPTTGMPPVPSENGSDVRLTIDVSNFSVVKGAGQANEPGQGRVRYYLDFVPGSPGGVTVEQGRYMVASEDEFTWEDVGPGLHIFAVELVNNDDTPINPPVVAAVTLVMESVDAPAVPGIVRFSVEVAPQSTPVPSPGSVGADARVSVQASGFTGEQGNYIYYLDYFPPLIPGQTATPPANQLYRVSDDNRITWNNVTPGQHQLWVLLADNNNIPLSPAVMAGAYLTVKSALPVTVTPTPTSSPTPTEAAPGIPHTLEGRTDCLLCHATGIVGAPAVPPDHSGRGNNTCLSCHRP